MKRNVLILGGTTEASRLAAALAARGDRATLSYAGRVVQPRSQPVPVRVGGFGGVEGLIGHLRSERVSHLVDASHPFAAQISRNAVLAASAIGLPLLAFTRAGWTPQAGDRWSFVWDIPAAAKALAGPPQRVFLALGRLNLAAFTAQPQHRYLLRLVDPPDGPVPLPDCEIVLARGPFEVESDITLMRTHGVQVVVAKDSGGAGADAKLTAARKLGVPVVLIRRPKPPARQQATSLEDVLNWLDHRSTDRGV